MRTCASAVMCLLAVMMFVGCTNRPADQWTPLFDGRSLANWKASSFPESKSEPRVEEGMIVLPAGTDLTGVTFTGGALPTTNYEIELQAKRIAGNDFFCGLTFPVADSHASLIVGGWGGELCGISSLNGDDAAHNETGSSRRFEQNRWYLIRVRVTPGRIEAFIDNEQIVDVDVSDRHVGVRWEVEPSRPLGIASWQTTAALRNIRLRHISPQLRAP